MHILWKYMTSKIQSLKHNEWKESRQNDSYFLNPQRDATLCKEAVKGNKNVWQVYQYN